MLENIKRRDGYFRFIPDVQTNELHFNLFKADSFTLVIGENGSGKTTLLKEISLAMSSEKRAELLVRTQASRSGVREFGTIYYTPIPYQVSLPRDSGRFINATPKSMQKAIDIEHFVKVSKMLSLTVHPKAVMRYDYYRVINTIGREIIVAYRDGTIASLDKSLSELLESIRPRFSTLLDFLKNQRAGDMDSYEDKNREIVVKAMTFSSNLYALLQERLGSHEVPILSALDYFLEKNSPTRYLVRNFLEEFVKWIHFPKDDSPSGFNQKRQRYSNLQKLISVHLDTHKRVKKWVARSIDGYRTIEAPVVNNKHLLKLAADRTQNIVDITWENFSSGQLGLLYQLSSIHRAAERLEKEGAKKLLLLIDEGDIYLHAAWQRKYIEMLDDLVSDLKKRFDIVQVVLTSHSLSLVTDVPRQCIRRLSVGQRSDNGPVMSFAAPLQDVINQSFQTSSIGSFAERILRDVANTIAKGIVGEREKFVISVVDDPIIRRELLSLKEKSGR